MKIIKHFKCWRKTRHQYEKIESILIDCGMGKMIIRQCKLCGKEKVSFV